MFWFGCLVFIVQTNHIIEALENVAISYSSNNHIKCENVTLNHSENYDVAEGEGIREWLEKCRAEGTLVE
jgi:hypothetical protein